VKTAEEFQADRALARLLTARRDAGVPIRRFLHWPEGWLPEQGRCHRNVERWVSERPGWRILRGWIVNHLLPGFSTNYASHSVVVDAEGELWDVTKNDFDGRLFYEHAGSIEEYLANVGTRRWAEISDA
jgi:hypothetical protein